MEPLQHCKQVRFYFNATLSLTGQFFTSLKLQTTYDALTEALDQKFRPHEVSHRHKFAPAITLTMQRARYDRGFHQP